MSGAVKDVDAYLASAPDTARAPLEKLRKLIRRAAPDAEEVISYQVPSYKQNGFLVSFGFAKGHCSFYTVSETLMLAMRDEVKPYLSGKTALHFTSETPLPDALVIKIVKARVEENEAKKMAKMNSQFVIRNCKFGIGIPNYKLPVTIHKKGNNHETSRLH